MTITAVDTRYYIDEFSDEHIPCNATLAGWAEWLSKPDEEWHRPEPAADGDRFKASVTIYAEDIVARHDPAGGWQFDGVLEGNPSLLAVRWGKGLGWSADNIIDGPMGQEVDGAIVHEPMTLEHVRAWLVEHSDLCDDEEYIAVGYEAPAVQLVFHAGPPPTCTVETLQ